MIHNIVNHVWKFIYNGRMDGFIPDGISERILLYVFECRFGVSIKPNAQTPLFIIIPINSLNSIISNLATGSTVILYTIF